MYRMGKQQFLLILFSLNPLNAKMLDKDKSKEIIIPAQNNDTIKNNSSLYTNLDKVLMHVYCVLCLTLTRV